MSDADFNMILESNQQSQQQQKYLAKLQIGIMAFKCLEGTEYVHHALT